MKRLCRRKFTAISAGSRRSFLLNAAAVAAAMTPAVRSLGRSAEDYAQGSAEAPDVLVIGAGLAGLIAAREIHESGKRVMVLEASSRVGGRTWSVPFAEVGTCVDLGAEWVTPRWHTAMAAELERYGIPLDWDIDDEAKSPSGQDEPDALRAAMAQCDRDAALIRFDEPGWYEDALRFDVLMDDYVDSLDLDGTTRNQLLANAFSLMGSHHREYSAINLLHEIAGYGSSADAYGADSARISGGADALAVAIADDLGERVNLGWPVERIEHTASGVLVSGPQGSIRAPLAVIALPVNVLSTLDLRIPLSAAALSAIAEGHAGRTAKGWAAVAPGVDIDSMGWPDAIEAYTVQGDKAAALATFGIAVPDTQAALKRAWASVKERHPKLTFKGSYLNHDWSSFPYSRGTWACPRPGQQQGWHDLADNPPPCVFAGGDLSRRWFGWMEGAVTSGRDAASRLLKFLDGEEVPRAAG